MEGVGARFGRSSSRYGTPTVFTGPVRKWKKDWIPICPPSSSSSSSSYNNFNNQNHHHSQPPPPSCSLANGSSLNGNNTGSVSHLRLFKWTPVSEKDNLDNDNHNNVGTENGSPTNDNSKDDAIIDPPSKKKFKYIPIALLEEQKKEAQVEENDDDEAKSMDADKDSAEQDPKSDDHSEKPDINDVPIEEIQAAEEYQTAPGRQDLNESLDFSLDLNSHEGNHDSDAKANPTEDQ